MERPSANVRSARHQPRRLHHTGRNEEPAEEELTTLYAPDARGSFTISPMNNLGIRIAFLILVVVLCCGWSFWTLSGRKSDAQRQPQILQIVNPAIIYSGEIERSGF